MDFLKVVVVLAVGIMNVTAAQAGEHAHFAAFFNNGSNASFAFPATVVGDNVEQDMMKMGAEMMIFAHSAGIKNGDVWSLQNNTLRDVKGVFQDFGVGCELSMTLPPMKVGGLCSVFMSDAAGSGKTKQIITPMVIAKEVVWYKIFEDKTHGLAGYFMRETGETIEH